MNKKYLLLENNYMAYYSLEDIENDSNVKIIHFKRVSKHIIINILFNIHNSVKINRRLNLPFKSIWDRIIFGKLLKEFNPDYIVFTTSWFSTHLIDYFRTHSRNSKLILRFSDMVERELGKLNKASLLQIKTSFDGVVAYSIEDSIMFGFSYHSVGYSRISEKRLSPKPQYDVVFVGADKGRLDKIRAAYRKFTNAGLTCFFYVTLVKKEDRKKDGIVYADKNMSFDEYLSYEKSAKCLFEIVQDGSSGRTYRMMEAIIYNKLLITNCPEIKSTKYFCTDYVQLYKDVSEIDPTFIEKNLNNVDYKYDGDFSPKVELEYIARNW